MNEPLITDWINSIAALFGVPLVIWGIIQLFIKNKTQERKLISLENLANSQKDVAINMSFQIQELTKQTSEFHYQSEMMKESNLLMQKQIEIQNDMFLYNKLSKEKKIELQKMEKMSEIKPYFVVFTYSSHQDEQSILLINKGGLAKSISLIQIGQGLVKFNPISKTKRVDKNEKIVIKGNTGSNKYLYPANAVPFKIELLYEDIDGNKYKQQLDNNFITNPVLIN